MGRHAGRLPGKIFNIPFVLPGIPAGSLRKMLDGLAIQDPQGAFADATAPSPPAEQALPGSEDVQGPAPAGPDGIVPDSTRQGSPAVPEVGAASAESHAEPVVSPPRPLIPSELGLLSELEAFVSTPREAKRMFNLYRMLRATEDLSDAASFLGDDQTPGEYQSVGILLGMLIANPHLLGAILDAPRQNEPPVEGGLIHRPASGQWQELVADITPKEHDMAEDAAPSETAEDRWSNQIVGTIPESELPAWQRFGEAATRTCNLVSLPDLTAFQRWAPVIKRFSFVLSPVEGPVPQGR